MSSLTTNKTRLYKGSKAFTYQTSLGNQELASAATKEESIALAFQRIEGALKCQTSRIHATVANDGTIIVTREYSDGEVECAHIRDGSTGCSSMGRCQIDCKDVTVKAYHDHEVERYNECTAPADPMNDFNYVGSPMHY